MPQHANGGTRGAGHSGVFFTHAACEVGRARASLGPVTTVSSFSSPSPQVS